MCVVVTATVGWVGSGMEVVDGIHVGQRQGVGRMLGDSGEFS